MLWTGTGMREMNMGGHTFGDDSHNPFGSYDNSWADQQREAALGEKKDWETNECTSHAETERCRVLGETNRMAHIREWHTRRDFGDDFRGR